MKKTGRLLLIAAIILVSGAIVVTSCKKDMAADMATGLVNPENLSVKNDTLNCGCVINPSDTITQAEIDMLLYMREEEKLARDVYLAMAEIYSVPVFRNIAKSEQHHMNQVLCLLQHYQIPDPASPDTGVFNNTELQALYNSFVAQGADSLVGALTAGATIEDKDIYDLEADMQLTENPAIVTIFSKLSCASGNHIRSFSAHLEFHGTTYVPQFISQEEYEGIIALPHQFCGAAGIGQTSGSPSVQ
jgi:hypothetical protein